MKYLIIIALMAVSAASFGQNQHIGSVSGRVTVPGGFVADRYLRVALDTTDADAPNGSEAYLNGVFYGKIAGVWTAFASGGSGVSNFFDLGDVDSTGMRDGYIPYYDLATGNILFQSPGFPIPSGSSSYNVEDSTNTPPVSFPVGVDTTYWMVGGAGTGIFSGNNYKIAMYVSGVFDSFITPDVGDFALTLDDGVDHRYDGSTWPQTYARQWNTKGNFGGGILGSSNASPVYLRYNNQDRVMLTAAGTRFPQMNGTNNAIATLNSGGLIQRREPVASSDTTANKPMAWATDGTIYRMESWPGGGGGGTQGFQDVLDIDPDVTTDNTVSGATTFTWDISRQIFNADDSIRIAAANDIGINSLGTARTLAATIYDKAALAQFGSNSKTILHYETGTGDSVAIELKAEGMRFTNTPTGSTGSILRRDANGFIGTSTTINAATELLNAVPIANGGTNITTYTTGDILYASATNVLSKLPVGTTGQQLTVSGGLPAWATSTNYWQRAQYGALASTNILQQATLTDTVALFSGLGAIRAKFNVSGNANITERLQVGGNAAMNATYELDVANDIRAQGTLEVDDKASINTFGAAVAGQALTVGLSNVSGGGGIFIGTNSFGQSGTGYGVKITPNVNQTSTSAGVGWIGVYSNPTTSNSATPVSNFWIGLESRFSINSTNATNIVLGDGLKTSLEASLGTQKITTYNALHDYGITSNVTLATDYYGLRRDSFAASRVSGNIYPIYIPSNSTNSEINLIQPKTSIGTLTTPTSYLYIGGSLAAQLTSTSADLTLSAVHYSVMVDASGANRTITLPAASGCVNRIYIIKKTDASGNTVTIDGAASETIDGATTKVLSTQYGGYMIQCNGSEWFIISTF